jgi:hypothetical protein
MTDFNQSLTQSIEILLFTLIYTFFLSFLVSFSFRRLGLLPAASTSKVDVVHASSLSRRRLARGGAPHRSLMAPLTIIGPDKTGPSGLPNWIVRFLQLQAGASGFCSFYV